MKNASKQNPNMVIHPTDFDPRPSGDYEKGLCYLEQVDIELDKPTIERLIPILKKFLQDERGAKRIRFFDRRPGVHHARPQKQDPPA